MLDSRQYSSEERARLLPPQTSGSTPRTAPGCLLRRTWGTTMMNDFANAQYVLSLFYPFHGFEEVAHVDLPQVHRVQRLHLVYLQLSEEGEREIYWQANGAGTLLGHRRHLWPKQPGLSQSSHWSTGQSGASEHNKEKLVLREKSHAIMSEYILTSDGIFLIEEKQKKKKMTGDRRTSLSLSSLYCWPKSCCTRLLLSAVQGSRT